MPYTIVHSTKGADFDKVAALLQYYGLSQLDGNMQKLVFERSYAVSFLYDKEKLIGFGRALSDGISQAAIYNIALEESYHGKKLGRRIIEDLISQVKGCSIILYTHPKTVSLYEHLGFRRMKTRMAMYQETALEKLIEMDFI